MNASDGKKLLARWFEEGSFAGKLPEVAALRGVRQADKYHSEGDAFIHTMLAVEAVADDADPRVFWGVLLHDIGKALTTGFIRGRWRSHRHEEEGAKLVPEIMSRMGLPDLAMDVAWLVRHHDFLLSWNLKPDFRLTARQRRFTELPLFPLLLQVSAADAAASWGRSRKGEDGRRLGELLAGKI
ncbi:MAG TPA: HD domain-containing protein [Geobacteraceae bacterium]|nr:HD domain-containing protein [Geobacteraceae bacterium]